MEHRSQNARTSLRYILLLPLVCCLIGAGALRWRHAQSERAALTSLPAAFAHAMPQRVLWAWEEPEDLHGLSPSVGVAYLAETLILGEHAAVLPRRQLLVPAANAPVMAVVRVETRRGFMDTPELRGEVSAWLAEVARRPGVRALQVDFDATTSQLAFYAGVLRMLRPQLPRGLPLSITALVSWCGPHSWLASMPIDEAVPMFFRMGGPRSISAEGRYRLTEPLCRTSVGLATDEPWPVDVAALEPSTRVYLFAPRPWQEAQLDVVATASLSRLSQEFAR